MSWQIVEFEGHPAVTMGWESNYDKPLMERTLWYNPQEEWNADYYSSFYDGRLQEGNHFLFINRRTFRYASLDTTGWISKIESKPIPRPGRGGKNWHWEWQLGKWQKSS